MNQQTSFLSLGCMTKLTRADRFLDEMNRVVPWAELVEVVAPHWGGAQTGRKATEVELLLRLHCLQLWYNLSDSGLEDEYSFAQRYAVFVSMRNLTAEPEETQIYHALTPSVARFRNQTDYGSLWTIGVKGTF